MQAESDKVAVRACAGKEADETVKSADIICTCVGSSLSRSGLSGPKLTLRSLPSLAVMQLRALDRAALLARRAQARRPHQRECVLRSLLLGPFATP